MLQTSRKHSTRLNQYLLIFQSKSVFVFCLAVFLNVITHTVIKTKKYFYNPKATLTRLSLKNCKYSFNVIRVTC